MTDSEDDALPDKDLRRSRRQAVAMGYARHGDRETPRVLAKGYGEIAEQIMQRAREQGIYVHDAPELVGLLMQLDLDERVPPRLYEVIAELLVWVKDIE